MNRPTRSLPPTLLALAHAPLLLLPDPGAAVLSLGYFAFVSVAALFAR